MSYEVIARKWRPRQFGEVVGQEHVTRTLSNAIASGRIAHAYLFVGPRGIGKTSLARIFAKALNCATGPTASPCDRCDACREIAAGTNLDVLEIDGASNNGVDQVRELRDTVKYLPARGPYKIYIIDEVHMLSAAAFNALLKTLEEPPAHVKFIFATTEPEKILPTILSRCQRFDLRRIPTVAIVDHLRLICGQEGVEISDEALLAIARASEGGMRDAQSALDQMISFTGRTIGESDVLSVFGLVARNILERLAGAMLGGDVPAVLRAVGELDAAGKDLQRVTVELAMHLRNVLVVKSLGKDAESVDLPAGAMETLRTQAEGTETWRVLRCIEIVSEAESKMRYTLSRRALLEVSLIRCARAAQAVPLEEILRRIVALESGVADAGGAASEAASGRSEATLKPERASKADAAAPVAKEHPKAAAPVAETQQKAAPAVRSNTTGGKEPPAELEALCGAWREVATEVGKLVVAASAALADSRPVAVEPNRVVVAFDPEFAEDVAKFKVPRNRKALEKAVSRVLGRDVGVEVALGDGPTKPCPPGGTVVGVGGPADKKSGRSAKKDGGNLVDTPEVQATLNIFRGKVTDVRW